MTTTTRIFRRDRAVTVRAIASESSACAAQAESKMLLQTGGTVQEKDTPAVATPASPAKTASSVPAWVEKATTEEQGAELCILVAVRKGLEVNLERLGLDISPTCLEVSL